MYLEEIADVPGYENLISHLKSSQSAWLDFYAGKSGIPTGWESPLTQDTEVNKLIRDAVIVRLIKPD